MSTLGENYTRKICVCCEVNLLKTTKPAAAVAESVLVVGFFLVGSVRAMNSQVTPHTPLLANRMKKIAGAGGA